MKKILLILVIFVFLLFTAACSYAEKAGILFNQHPITTQNVTDYSTVFAPGSRIYYLIIMPKIQNSRILTVQIIKKGSAEYLGYSLHMTRTIRLKDEEKKYYTDYFVINEKGAYIMKVYSNDKPQQVLTQAQFFVK